MRWPSPGTWSLLWGRARTGQGAPRTCWSRKQRIRLPDAEVLQREENTVVGAALARLSPAEREVLLAHEVDGAGTAELAARRGSTPGAIAAQLNRTRAKLRVEYLMADTGVTPPTDRCRPVLFALSAGDRRRQRELDTAGHLLDCDCCLGLSTALFDRRPPLQNDDEARVMVTVDADVVTARQQGRDIAARAGFTSTDLTLIATAISEIARNIVKFARRGEIVIRLVDEPGRRGVTVVARDAGPGIGDIAGCVAGRREHLPGPGPRVARRPPVDGRVRHRLRGRQGNHRDDGEMAMTHPPEDQS